MKSLFRTLKKLNPLRAVAWLFWWLRNRIRRMDRNIDTIQFNLPESMTALPESKPLWQRFVGGGSSLSLYELDQHFQRIAEDPRPRTVLLFIRELDLGLADIQTLRTSIHRLRQSGKRVVTYAHEYDMRSYYVASAADSVVLQPGGDLMTLGLLARQVYLREGLAAVGIEADVVAISPYKSAGDQISRSEPSEEVRNMTNWLLDSQFEQIVNDIARDRNVEPEAVRAMIDSAPLTDTDARDAGYIDALINEEDLPAYLDTKNIRLWRQVKGRLLRPWRKRQYKYVAVLRAAGRIIPGESQNRPIDIPLPLVGGESLGDATLVRQVRQLMRDDSAAAVVLWIDSPGGSATASEAMASALEELARTRPLIACMNGVAASGGYYIATPAEWIVARPGTITGSIGVLTVKLVGGETLRRLRLNTVLYRRGAHADLFATDAPYNDTQRERVRGLIERIYETFVERVANSRKMKPEEVDRVGGGRVWTGEQALTHGLIDELGGLEQALAKARELAKLPDNAPVDFVSERGKALPVQPQEALDPAAGLRRWQQALSLLADSRPQMWMPFEHTLWPPRF